MKTNPTVLFLAALSLVVTGCRREPYPMEPALGRTNYIDEDHQSAGRRGPEPDGDDEDMADAPLENPDEPVASPVNPVPVPIPTQPAFAKKVDGKPGFVESPYAAGKLIDVRGLPPGTEIECPYTKRPIALP